METILKDAQLISNSRRVTKVTKKIVKSLTFWTVNSASSAFLFVLTLK